MRDAGSGLLELNVPLCSRLDRKPLVQAAGPMTRHKIFLLTSSAAARPPPPEPRSERLLTPPLTHRSTDQRSSQRYAGKMNYQSLPKANAGGGHVHAFLTNRACVCARAAADTRVRDASAAFAYLSEEDGLSSTLPFFFLLLRLFFFVLS